MAAERRIKGVTVRARVVDRLGRHLIAVGGIGIIAAVLGIFVFILGEAYPLFEDPELVAEDPVAIERGAGRMAVGIDPYQGVAFLVGANGLEFIDPRSGEAIASEPPEELAQAEVTAAHSWRNGRLLALGMADGSARVGRVNYTLEYVDEERIVQPRFELSGRIELDEKGEAFTRIYYSDDEDGRSALVGITASGRLLIAVREQRQGLLGPGRLEQEVYELAGELEGRPAEAIVDAQVRHLLVGTDTGQVGEWRLGDYDEKPLFRGAFAAAEKGTAVTALDFILGDVSVVVGDATGKVSTWFKVEGEEGREYRQIHRFTAHGSAVRFIAASQRDKQFLTADEEGAVALHHMTSEQTFFRFTSDVGRIAAICFAPKADGFLILGREGKLEHYKLENPHPDVTAKVLFKKIWYEGYQAPEYVWQSTGGSDEFEPKISLIPLAFGTLKATLYAMLFALPLAVFAAIYTAEFASPTVRNLVKPTVEVMASLPSVILGFLAGLWLAPLLESRMVGTLMLFPLVPAFVVVAAWIWHQLPEDFVRKVAVKGEIYLLVVVALAAVWFAYAMGPVFERVVFGGNFLHWLTSASGSHYDQRNCLVVGFAMGFAVIPLIFTICEDSLSSVPRHLRAGSLALGATRWQTAIRVVLPMAIPGIFSAAMIGFGRAIGETMIVLMATGNTPIMDWNIFNGMRTISANIAVELPEAPHHGSLYRVLFLSGLLLFMVTFLINGLAEVVRQHLREKYNRL